MTPPPEVDLSPWAVAVAVLGAAVGPQLAQYISAYAIILFGWGAGLLYGSFTRAPDSKMPIWAYALLTLIVCLLVTVPASEFASHWVPFSYTALLFPIAVLIPAVPDKWNEAGAWLIRRWQLARGIQQ